MSDDEEAPSTHPTAPDRRAAFAAVVEEYQQPVGAYLVHLVDNREAALALTVETFLRAYHARADVRSRSSLRAWLYRMATRLAYGYLLGRRSVRLRPQGVGSGLIQAVLDGLQPTDRALLLLCDLEQMRLDEAALVLGMATERLQQRLAQARARFRSSMVVQHSVVTSRGEERPQSI